MSDCFRVSVVVPCYNERDYIAEVVSAVLGPKRDAAVIELLVVDGGSTDGTSMILQGLEQRYADLHVLTNPDREIPKAMNIGIRAARGDVIVRMDAHSRYPSDYVGRLLARLAASPDAGNVGGAWDVLPANSTLPARVAAAAGASRFGVGSALYRVGHRGVTDADTVPFGCFRRTVLERVGLYDEQLVRNEDDELNARIRAAGYRIVLDPSIRIGYFSRPTIMKLAQMFFQYGFFKPLVVLKTRKLTSLRQLAPPALLVTMALLLGCLCIRARLFARPFVLLVGAYFVFLGCGAMALKTRGFRLGFMGRLLAIFCLAAVHASYGFGYIRGCIEFVVLRRHRVARRLEAVVTR